MSTMNYPALVLNADFQPVSVFPLSTWGFERTMRNVLKGRIIELEHYDKEFHSANFTYRPPSVVALKTYVNKPKRVAFSRLNIFLRDNFTCQYCGNRFHADELTFDHVTPRALGGKTNFENIVSACVPCNTSKGHKTHMKPMTMPRAPSIYELAKAKTPSTKGLHKTWIDYLYWSGVLEQED